MSSNCILLKFLSMTASEGERISVTFAGWNLSSENTLNLHHENKWLLYHVLLHNLFIVFPGKRCVL
jgi:hypothetical protein